MKRQPEPNTREWWEARAAEARRTCEWRAFDVPIEDWPRLLPPKARLSDRRRCWNESKAGCFCSRPDGHTGRHSADGIQYVLAVWL